jgi:hypothetical protein
MEMGLDEQSTRHPITPIVSHIQHTHERIRRDLEALAEVETTDEIGEIIDDLSVLLREHFGDEEKPGGLFDELCSLRPTIDSQLKFLRGEHREIVQALEGIQAEIREAEQVTQAGELELRCDHTRTSAAAFIQLIRHHERIESQLVRDTYYTEDGGSG